MRNENDGLVFALVFLVVPAAYIAWLTLPLFFFYVVPFALSALLVANVWLLGCEYRHVNYRRVAGLMAGTILLLLATVGFPKPVFVNAKGKIQIESQVLFNAFNRWNQGTQEAITQGPLRYFRPLLGRLMPPAEYESTLYDLRDLSWALWLGVCFGAPALFLKWAKEKDQERMLKLLAECETKVEEANRERREAEHDYRSTRSWASQEIKQREKEIKKLQAVVDSVKKDLPPPAPIEAPGSTAPENPPGKIFGPNGV